jgi:hypothetical protein
MNECGKTIDKGRERKKNLGIPNQSKKERKEGRKRRWSRSGHEGADNNRNP